MRKLLVWAGLLAAGCGGKSTDEWIGQLKASESAQRRYIEHVQLCTELADWSSATVPMSIPYQVLANGADSKVRHQRPASATLQVCQAITTDAKKIIVDSVREIPDSQRADRARHALTLVTTSSYSQVAR